MKKDTWEFWKPIVENEDGSLNVEQVKKELADFSVIMEQVPIVYCHITGDTLSKCNYFADQVISVADEIYRKRFMDAAKEMFADLKDGGEINKNAYDNLLENLERYF